MDFITKLERKYGKYAIPNLTLFLIGGFVIGYLIQIMNAGALSLLALNPAKIMEGQIYRLITWVIMPPGGANILVIITLMFYYSVGRTLENIWGDFRYNLYILSGIIFTDIGKLNETPDKNLVTVNLPTDSRSFFGKILFCIWVIQGDKG